MMNKNIKKQIERLEKQHDKIKEPICYSGNCIICNKIKELKEKYDKD